VGARYCPLVDRLAAHVYYANDDRHLSVFVFAGPARFAGYELGTEARGREVRLLRSAGMTVALVSEHSEDVAAFRDHFTTTTALLDVAGPASVHVRVATMGGPRSVDLSRPRLLTLVFPSGAVAQLGARVNGIHEVTGSIPVSSTNSSNKLRR
jgi:hypothetical protein